MAGMAMAAAAAEYLHWTGVRHALRLRAATWLVPLVADPLECALDLGSLAMAATLRTLVNRPEVVKIRGALGPERFARVLASPAASSQSSPVPPAGDLDMVERLIRC